MIGSHFRPWGQLNWLLPKLPLTNWDLVGCISTEDRFIATFQELRKSGKIGKSLFYKIIDPPSSESSIIYEKLNKNESKLRLLAKTSLLIEEHNLLEPYRYIVESITKFITLSSRNIIIDISTFPKRFFFPIIKILMNSKLQNFIVTYCTPDKYCSYELSGNPFAWDHLPLFMPVDFPDFKPDIAIVGVGFMPFGLPDLLYSQYSSIPIKFLFPFPPGPPNYQRTWEFMYKIEKFSPFKQMDALKRIDSNNMADAFSYISRETDFGEKRPVFAPYGPKPISLAMCIYASLTETPVYYTQPTYYNPNYSEGIKDNFGYCIVLNNKNLYSYSEM